MNVISPSNPERGASISPQMLAQLAGQAQLTTGEGRAGGERGRVPPLRWLWKIALRRRWILLGCVAGGLILALVASLLVTRQYSSTARLEIARESDRVTKIDSVERETSIGDQEFYQTQYGLLQATGLAERVARDLNLVDDPAFFRMFGRDDMFESGALPVSDPSRRAKRDEIAGKILLDHVGIAPVRGSSLVDITAITPDPALSQRIAQMWGKDFIESTLERRFQASAYARQFLEGRIGQLREKLEDSERLVVAYAAHQGIIELPTAGSRDDTGTPVSGERSILTDDLATINGALATATAARIEAGAQLAALRHPDASSDALSNLAISNMREKRAEIAADYAKQSVQFTPDYPPVKALAGQLAQIDRSLNTEITRMRTAASQAYDAASAREIALRSNVNGLKSQFMDMRQRSIQYNIYLRDAQTNRDLYNSLLQRYKEIGVAGATENNNIAVVNIAKLPDHPSRPNLMVNLLLGLLAGGLVGMGVAAALEQIDESISDPAEVPERLGLPLLGTIPVVAGEDPIAAMRNPRSALVEAYLAIRANLELSTSQGVPRSLAVTSSRPREGKSTTALALAQSLARSNRRVLLLDADMRAPSLHKALGVPNHIGVSNVLAGGDMAEAILKTDIANLSLMTAGPQPPNAADLLTGSRLHDLIEHLLKSFDNVVVDAPPVVGLADAALVAGSVSAMLFVLESGTVHVRQASEALRRLQLAHATIVGVVLTKFNAKRASLGDTYAYGYEYFYGYGDAKSEAAE
jgi:succinoglycan biosynthesis transport protein ExoP